MKTDLKREAPVSVYPPIMLYNTEDISKIWEPCEDRDKETYLSNLYLHIPYCAQRCEFCSYVVFPYKESEISAYVAAVKKEIDLLSNIEMLKKQKFHTIYLGGGTPTILRTEYLESLIKDIYKNFKINDSYEFSVEIRPGNEATEEKMQMLKNMGVNRISIGVQSFDQNVLDLNGRRHKNIDFFRIYESLRKIGFTNINLDIISGLIGETEETWENTINKLLELNPENVTLYRLNIYKKSILYKKMDDFKKSNMVMDEAKEVSMAEYFYKRMFNDGYELSSSTYTFTKSKAHDHAFRLSRNGGNELLGIGLSANSYINRTAFINTNTLESYLESIEKGVLPAKRAYRLSQEEVIKRAFLFGFKTSKIDRNDFKARYGVDPVNVEKEGLQRMLEDGLVEINENEICLTPQAYIYADDIVRKYIMSSKESSMEKLLLMHKNVDLKI